MEKTEIEVIEVGTENENANTNIDKVEELHTIISNLSDTITNMTQEIQNLKQAQEDYKASQGQSQQDMVDEGKSFLDWLSNK